MNKRLAAWALAGLSLGAMAQDTQLYWGDTHLHTGNSTDAFDNGAASVDTETAYRFARGLPVIHPATGQRLRIDRPLDFLVIADHAEMLGLAPRLQGNDPDILATAAGRRLKALFDADPFSLWRAQIAISLSGANQDMVNELHVPGIIQGAWEAQIDAAEKHNSPGEFTALIGWEWSSSSNDTNLHRVIFTADGGAMARRFRPFSAYDSDRPEDLWDWLDFTSALTGARFLAIPHNGNLSKGLMFAGTDSRGEAMTRDQAQARSRWEPVMEITQYKGTSETHPVLAPTDEFADFELREFLFSGQPADPLPGSFARPALKTGLALEGTLGINPYKFGMIGSTDAHTGLASVEEGAFLGKSGLDALPAQRPQKALALMSAWEVSASGLAAAWATANTREGIFEAFRRREVYATSGPRIALRVFAGFDFAGIDLDRADLAAQGYRRGVPMGGDLTAAPANRPLSLLIEAVADPRGATLDRVQVIKGWQAADGEVLEKVFDVAWAGNRRLRTDGKLPAIDNTVALADTSYDNATGAPRLAVTWQDPEFDPALRAFYYVRVLEIPTPRHHVYDAVALGLDLLTANPGHPATLQERAWSSPVWYTP